MPEDSPTTATPHEPPGAMPPSAADALEQAIRHLARGESEAALHAASEACHEAPERPEPHYAYGQAWAALGKPAEAERAFAAALKLAPTWADAWVNFGVARYRQASMDDAITSMQEALRHDRAHAGAAANLGTFLRLTGNAEAGHELLRSTIEATPDNAAARLNLAADLLQEERSDEALALLDAVAPPADPLAARHYHLARALAHLQKGGAADGRAALDSCAALGPIPPDLAPLWHWRRLLLALAEHDEERARAEAERTQVTLAAMSPSAVPEHRVMTHYDLAKFWSGRGAHARAFGHWVEGHRLLAASQPFSRAAHRAFVEANVATFTRERFEAGPRAQNSDPAPVFIVGMPRSGTTLCEQILAAHRDVHGAGERPALGRAFKRLAGDETRDAVARLAGLDAATLDIAAAHYLAELRAQAPDKTRIVDKMPANYLNLALVGLMLPGARIIHCTRDPRDIGLSIFTFRFHGLHPYAHDLADLGWTIAQQARLMEHWKGALPNPILTVALADWVDDFDGTLARVLDHLGLAADEACTRFYESERTVRTASRAQVRQPINARGLGRWRRYAKALAPLVKELETADLIPADDPDAPRLRVVRPEDPARSLALAVTYLMDKPAFATLPFGSWSKVLAAQVARGACCFLLDEWDIVQGFCGWFLTSRAHAEAWLANASELPFNESGDQSCMIINAWAGETPEAVRLMVNEMRAIAEGREEVYFRRHYASGRWRPSRVRLTSALSVHLAKYLGA